jgi:tetratricopeptide (TPR) repeat protein
MRKFYSLILFLACALLAVAQTHASADKLFQAGDYATAQEQYGKLLKSYPREALYLYRYARCAQELGDFSTAIQYFDKAGDRYMLKYFYLGEIYLQQWYADAAIEAYNKYLSSLTEPNEREPYIAQQMAHAEKIQRYLRRVERVTVIDSVLVPLHQMLLQCSLSPEAGRLQYDSLGGIEFTNQRGDHRLWSQLVDSNQLLLSSHRLLDTWTTSDTLPTTINFTTSQISPYLLNDGVTLYFAAQDSNGLGGWDIYISRYNTATELYTAPENLGFPYNSPSNEYMYILDENQGVAYLATDRFAPQGYVHIYSLAIPEQKQYCRGMTSDSLAAYAQLRAFCKTERSDNVPSEPSKLSKLSEFSDPSDPSKLHDAISFVINDSVIYTSVDAFLSQEAKQLFMEWEQLQERLTKEQNQLEQLRMQYMQAEETLQAELAPRILQLESDIVRLQERCWALPREIRQRESSKL